MAVWLERCAQERHYELLDAMWCRVWCEYELRRWCVERFQDGALLALCHACVLRWLYGKPCLLEDPGICHCVSADEICAPYRIAYGR